MMVLRRRMSGFLRDREGAASLEFAILILPTLYILFSIAEAGLLMARTVMMDRGLDMAVRDIRLGLETGETHDGLKTRICEEAFLVGDCEDSLVLELAPLENTADFGAGEVNCVDRKADPPVAPVIEYDSGSRGEIMFVRACLIVDPLFPGMGLGALLPVDASGGHAIVVQGAFMNEPT